MNICFARNKPAPSTFTLDDVTIQQCNTVKLLGIFIQSNLKWDKYVNYIVKRANSRLYMLRKLKYHFLSTSDLILIYTSFVRPTVEYATPVWSSGITKQQCNTIERIQKRACRIALGPDYVRYGDALQVCKLETLECRRKQLSIAFAKSLKNSKLESLVPETRSISGYNLRNSTQLTELKCNTSRFKNSPVPHLINLLNTTQ